MILKGALKGTLWLFVFLFSAVELAAQEEPALATNKKDKVQKYTVMEKFEPELVLPADERKRLKEERKQLIAQRRNILDTLSISDRRRQRLLRELNKNPFSDRINRTFADIEFEDAPEDGVEHDD